MSKPLEEALVFACQGEHLVGILHHAAPPREAAVIIVVGGPQYRVGSHRQFVHLARRLAEAGYPVLRFDVRGMGDSTGSPRCFEEVHQDIAAAAECLQARLPTIRLFALIGLCDGASAALLYMQESRDERVFGLCLLNPWVRSEESLAITHVKHYYIRRLLQPSFWGKLLGGGIKTAAMTDLVHTLRTALRGRADRSRLGAPVPFQRRMAQGWAGFSGHILLVLSGRDFTAMEFVNHVERDEDWKAAFRRGRLDRHELAKADHTFSDEPSRTAVESLVINWLQKCAAQGSQAPHSEDAGVLT